MELAEDFWMGEGKGLIKEQMKESDLEPLFPGSVEQLSLT